jgi:hypothetical protein
MSQPNQASKAQSVLRNKGLNDIVKLLKKKEDDKAAMNQIQEKAALRRDHPEVGADELQLAKFEDDPTTSYNPAPANGIINKAA